MRENVGLFDSVKFCQYCGKPLPDTYKQDLCPICYENQLFQQVKEYIRENDVNEFDVASHFHIPLSRVKSWIREGRIEYKENTIQPALRNLHCQKCGAPISFGSLCSNCLKKQNRHGTSYVSPKKSGTSEHMRFLDSENTRTDEDE